jgi:hypothetical protein
MNVTFTSYFKIAAKADWRRECSPPAARGLNIK